MQGEGYIVKAAEKQHWKTELGPKLSLRQGSGFFSAASSSCVNCANDTLLEALMWTLVLLVGSSSVSTCQFQCPPEQEFTAFV